MILRLFLAPIIAAYVVGLYITAAHLDVFPAITLQAVPVQLAMTALRWELYAIGAALIALGVYYELRTTPPQ